MIIITSVLSVDFTVPKSSRMLYGGAHDNINNTSKVHIKLNSRKISHPHYPILSTNPSHVLHKARRYDRRAIYKFSEGIAENEITYGINEISRDFSLGGFWRVRGGWGRRDHRCNVLICKYCSHINAWARTIYNARVDQMTRLKSAEIFSKIS